jgi:hypothetical protein
VARSFRVLRALAVTTVLTALPGGAAEASLIDYGGGLIYDTVQDLTWLDPSHVQPPHVLMQADSCGPTPCYYHYTWTGANAWTDGLSYEGYDDWRLPDKFEPGIFGGDNELHLMLAQLPGWQFGPVQGNEVELLAAGDKGPFQNLPPYWFVWMDETLSYTSGAAGGGYDFPDNPDTAERRVVAVRSGAPTSAVPEPSTLGALAIGMLAFARLGRRRRVIG